MLASERLVQFHHEGVDLAVRYGRPPFGSGLEATLLFSQTVLAVVSPALLAQRRCGAAEIACAIRCCTMAITCGQRSGVYVPRPSLQHQHHLRFNQTALALEAALSGQGIALTSPHLCRTIWPAVGPGSVRCPLMPAGIWWLRVVRVSRQR